MGRKINVKLILELRAAGMGRNQIAKTRKVSKDSVSDVFHIADQKGLGFEQIKAMTDEEVYR